MIYSQEINKICALCQKAQPQSDGALLCAVSGRAVENGGTCDKFSYDILKKPVRRRRRIKTDYNKEDFSL